MTFSYQIMIDEDPPNPREWDNLGTMVCWHPEYNLGDTGRRDNIPDWDKVLSLPLYLYDHSGISMSTRYTYPYNDPWDAGQVGMIYVELDKVREEYGWERLTHQRMERIYQYLRNEVEVYDAYLRGYVWGYVLYQDDEVLESSWGYFDRKDCEENAQAELDAYLAEFEDLNEFERIR